MAKEKIDLRKMLREYRVEFDLEQRIPCSKQRNKEIQKYVEDKGALPDGVYAYVYDTGEASTTEFYTIYKPDLTDAEVMEYLTYKKLSFIKTIKNCVVFFTVLTIIGMIYYAYLLSNSF